jgi:integrase/recombinase XerD
MFRTCFTNVGDILDKETVEEFLSSFDYADTTKDSYRRVLVKLPADPAFLRAADLVKFVSREGWGSSQRYTALCACRAFLRWLCGASHPALSARVKRIPTAPQPRLSAEQVAALIDSFDPSTVAGCRDRALAAVALDCNLRVTELCHLEAGNVYLEGGKLFALTKGGQWLWKTFSEVTADFVRSWLEVRSPALGVSALFITFHHANIGRPLTREGIQGIMKRWGKKVGFHISPHMFRRSYATLSTLNGAPENVVMVGGGWKSTRMVQHYIGDLAVETTRPYLPMSKLPKK